MDDLLKAQPDDVQCAHTEMCEAIPVRIQHRIERGAPQQVLQQMWTCIHCMHSEWRDVPHVDKEGNDVQ